MISLKPYVKIVRTSVREDSANAKRLMLGLAVSLIRVGLIAAIYEVAYRHAPHLGLSYKNAVWSIAIYFAFILNLGLRNVFKIVNRDIQTGAVEVGLIKPLDWRLSKVSELLGKNGLEFLLQLIVLPFFLLVVVGAPDLSHLSLGSILVFLLLTVLAMITASAMFLTVGLTAFWLNDATPVYRLLDKAALILGGGFVPIALLPHVAQVFVRYSPFGVYAAPTQLFNPGVVPVLWPTFVSAVLWSFALVCLCQWVWRRAEQRIEVNGG